MKGPTWGRDRDGVLVVRHVLDRAELHVIPVLLDSRHPESNFLVPAGFHDIKGEGPVVGFRRDGVKLWATYTVSVRFRYRGGL